MKSVLKIIYLNLAIFVPLFLFGQTETKLLRQGNKLYEQKKYKDAEISYRKAGSKAKDSFKANYNLGNSLYKQNNYEEAGNVYRNLLTKKAGKKELANSYYNLGNTFLQNKKYEESIKAYKNALRISPKDKDTKYNLEYAKKKLIQQKQQQQQQNKNQNNKNNQQKNKQQPPKSKPQNNENKKQQQQQKQISKQDAERMLQALKNDEKNTMDKLKKQNARKIKVAVEKDW